MRIYIASSWRNQHAVEMLTAAIRDFGHTVSSWIENNHDENPNSSINESGRKLDFEQWVNSESSDKSFKYDTEGAANCDLFIYLGPAGKDAAAECGIAFANMKPMLGLYAKGEDFGLMRKMFDGWFYNYVDLLNAIGKSPAQPSTSQVKWPTIGTSVMLNASPKRSDIEWVDAYVVRHLKNTAGNVFGIIVRTYWGQDREVTDPALLGNAMNGLGAFPITDYV